MTWSADVVADDWRHINASEVVRRAIARLDEKGKGILLLHDIQPATALALPELLRQLKAKGYRIVQVVPGKSEMSVPVAARPAPPVAKPAAQPTPGRAVSRRPRRRLLRLPSPSQWRRRKPPCPNVRPRRARAADAAAAQARDAGFGRRQSRARRRHPARPGAAVHLGIEAGAQHADAGQVRHHRAGRLAAGHQRAGADGRRHRRILGGAPGVKRADGRFQ